MKFDIARQPLVPALLTLLIFVIVAMCGAGQGVATPSVWSAVSAGIDGLELTMPAVWIERFQISWPRLARWISAFLILFAGLGVGRISIRHNLYGVGTCLNIALYGAILCGCFIDGNCLTTSVLALLSVRMMRNFSCAFRSSYAFDAIFRAGLYLGLAMLVSAEAAVLSLLMVIAVIMFRRTHRETLVGTIGLLLPIAALSYVNWGIGGSFTAPATALFNAAIAGTPLSLFVTIPSHRIILSVAVTLLAFMALVSFLVARYSASIKVRMIFLFGGYALALSVIMMLMPAARLGDGAFMAATAALLMPVMFVRTERNVATLLYVLLLLASLAGCII